MRSKTLASAHDLTSGTAGQEINLSGERAPFLPNYTSVLCLASADLADSVLRVQGRNGASDSWETLVDVNGDDVELDAPGVLYFTAVLPERIRIVAEPDTGGSPAGTGSVTALGN